MLYLNGHAQVMKAAGKVPVCCSGNMKMFGQRFVCHVQHVDNQCYKSNTHPKNLEKTKVSGFSIYFASPEQDIAAR